MTRGRDTTPDSPDASQAKDCEAQAFKVYEDERFGAGTNAALEKLVGYLIDTGHRLSVSQHSQIMKKVEDAILLAVAEEVTGIQRWLGERAEWLRQERARGGSPDLEQMRDETKAIADLLASGRHRRGKHLYAEEDRT